MCHTPVHPFRRAPVHPFIFPGLTLSGIFYIPQPSSPTLPLCFQAFSTCFNPIPPFSIIYAWSQGSVPVVSGFSRTSAAPGQQSAHRHRNQQQDREQLFHPRKNAQQKTTSQAHSTIVAFFQHFLTSQKNRLFSQAVSRKHGSGQPTHFQVMGISISGCRLCLTGQLRAACSSSFLSG